MTNYPVHPVAGLFPMLEDDALRELAEDIEARGLLQPVVLDAQGRLLDGRNRIAACRMVGVEPVTTTYQGDDPDGYALAVNVQRRSLKPGQRHLVTEQARRLARIPKSESDGHSPRLSEAAVVLDFAPDLVDLVMAGDLSLDTAAKEARERKRSAAETQASRDRLKRKAPDLDALVEEERMSLADAIAALESREENARAERDEREQERERRRADEEDKAQRFTKAVAHSLVDLWASLDPDPAAIIAKRWRPDANTYRALPQQAERFTGDGIRHIAKLLTVMADHVDENGGTL